MFCLRDIFLDSIDTAKYVGKSESKSWTRKKAKSVVTESLEKSQTMDPMELQNLVNKQSEMYPLGPAIALAYLSVLKDCEAHCLHEGSEVKRLGGLHVIGTSLHESRRIDNQVSFWFCWLSGCYYKSNLLLFLVYLVKAYPKPFIFHYIKLTCELN